MARPYSDFDAAVLDAVRRCGEAGLADVSADPEVIAAQQGTDLSIAGSLALLRNRGLIERCPTVAILYREIA